MPKNLAIGILALQGDYEAHARALARLGLTAERELDALTPPPPLPDALEFSGHWRLVRAAADLAGLQGLILPGGESTTMLKFLEDEPFWRELGAVVRRRAVLATCAGVILLAREVGNPPQRSLGILDVAVERNAYGRQIDSSVRQGKLLGRDLEMVFIRAPKITAAGPGVEILATESGLPVLVRQGRLLAATFHPELSRDLTLHRYFLDAAAAEDPRA
ncbi:MAG: pyridoxal 5'-phosphate synthase glutaminase subunit PdxT [Terriglobales bacterium]